eukprot:TRINITY_DN16481_c0_g5_i2.p1 TRINITY_DN16481_c0_g5~~TRINITY_DN16481_c0_g5_i2.p1  ORF type:complete len:1007 (-),score=58.41 TRINITY_DN16481_c0_g5_i2:85-3105(-)
MLQGRTLVATASAAFLAACWRSEATCLPNARHATRKVTVDGLTIPLGVWMNDWESARMASYVFRILAEDVLGYEVVFGPPGDGSVSAIWALAGCVPNQDCLHNDSRKEPIRRYHVALETYPWALVEWQQWKMISPERAPVRIHDIGYAGVDGTFIQSSIAAAGKADAGVSLTVYSSYDIARDLSPHFSKLQDINVSLLSPCASSSLRTSLVGQGGFGRYVDAFPDDVDGYLLDDDGNPWPRCFNGTWWASPACRETPDQCIPWITYKAWTATLHMQRAALYDMPIAFGFTDNWADYNNMPRQYKVLMYWFRPDSMFLDLDMQLVTFPLDEHRHFEGSSLLSRRHLPQSLDKWVIKDLQAREPLLMAQRFHLGADDMDDMLGKVAAGQGPGEAACEWLKSDAARLVWEAWIPLATDCVEGQGWADDRGRPVSTVAAATQCMWCAIGFVSQYDRQASGYVCTPCAAGKYFMVSGTGSCQSCGVGQFSASPGQTQCNWCERGRYTSSQGSSNCTACPSGFITEDIGQDNSSACVCERGLYLSVDKDGGGGKTCQSCGWLRAAPSSSSSSEDCDWELDNVRQAGLLVFAVACLCAGALAAALFRRYKRIQQDEAMHKTLKQGFRSISVPQHPMCLMPFICFSELSETELRACHEGARDRGALLVLDTAQDILDFQESERKVLFFSYTWTSWENLGPNVSQLKCMKAAAKCIRDIIGIDPEHLYVWLDVLGVPQSNDSCKALAVDSLYVYASTADYLVVICPPCIHETTDEVVGMETYKSRTWCRVEQMAHFSRHGLGTTWYSMYPGELIAIDEDWLQDAVHIFDGEVTCCRLGHPGKRKCDKQLLVPTVLAMYTALLRRVMSGDSVPADIQAIWNMMNVDRSRTFPPLSVYNQSGKPCHRELFGSTVDRIHDVLSTANAVAVINDHKSLRRSQTASVWDVWSLSRKRSRQRVAHTVQWLMEAAVEARKATHGQPARRLSTNTQLERMEKFQQPAVLNASSWSLPSTVVRI